MDEERGAEWRKKNGERRMEEKELRSRIDKEEWRRRI
jgi:hypothetical protein